MDSKSSKRVNGVYRNIKQLPLLGGLGVLIPIVGILLLPITLMYHFMMSQLLRDFRNNQFAVEDHDRVPLKPGKPSTEQQLHFLLNGSKMLWIPYLVGIGWFVLFGGLMTWVIMTSK